MWLTYKEAIQNVCMYTVQHALRLKHYKKEIYSSRDNTQKYYNVVLKHILFIYAQWTASANRIVDTTRTE